MRINIAYFTSTGNTLWLALKAARLLEEQGHEVRLYEAIGDGLAFTQDCDLIGILYPVWGSTLPDPLQDLVREMEAGRGKRMFLVGTCAAFTGDTGMYWKRIIEDKGYDCLFGDDQADPLPVGFSEELGCDTQSWALLLGGSGNTEIVTQDTRGCCEHLLRYVQDVTLWRRARPLQEETYDSREHSTP